MGSLEREGEEESREKEAVCERGEDLEAERDLLQQKVVQQKVQISSLLASIQATRYSSVQSEAGQRTWVRPGLPIQACSPGSLNTQS